MRDALERCEKIDQPTTKSNQFFGIDPSGEKPPDRIVT
jgi:hypothetical protein